MYITYYDEIASTNDASPQGIFEYPKDDKYDLLVKYFPDSEGPEYWITVAKIETVHPNDKLTIKIYSTKGILSNPATVDLNQWEQVWRKWPSTVGMPSAGDQGKCAILCVTDEITKKCGVDTDGMRKHPWAGGRLQRATFRAMARRFKAEIDQLPTDDPIRKARDVDPELFR